MTTRTQRRFRSIPLAMAALALLVLSACSAGGGASSADSDAVNIGFAGSISSLYVGQEYGTYNSYIASSVQEGLVMLDDQGAPQPSLATSWEQKDDLTLVFQIRDDAKFSDGSPLTPEDVVASLELALNPELSPQIATGNAETFAGAEVTGENEVTIYLANPDANALIWLSSAAGFFVTSAKSIEESGVDLGTPSAPIVGTGPYKVAEFVPDSKVVLERVDTWWGGVPDVETVVFNFMSDDNAKLLAAQKGELDMAFGITINQLNQWENIKNLRVEFVNDLSYVGLYFDTTVEPLSDEYARKAIAHAMDQETVVAKLLLGHGEVAKAMVPTEFIRAVYSEEETTAALDSMPTFEFSLEKAAEALANSAYPDGFEATVSYPNTGPEIGQALLALSENLKSIGVTLNVKEISTEQWLEEEYSDMGLQWWASDSGNPALITSYMVGEDSPTHINSPEIEELNAAQSVETDPRKRMDMLMQLNRLGIESAANVPLWWGFEVIAVDKNLSFPENPSAFLLSQPWPALFTRQG